MASAKTQLKPISQKQGEEVKMGLRHGWIQRLPQGQKASVSFCFHFRTLLTPVSPSFSTLLCHGTLPNPLPRNHTYSQSGFLICRTHLYPAVSWGQLLHCSKLKFPFRDIRIITAFRSGSMSCLPTA